MQIARNKLAQSTALLMPDMSGLEVVRGFAKRTPRPRLIVMSGETSGIDLPGTVTQLGADAPLAKADSRAGPARRCRGVLAAP
jgi:hypothetical protein